LSSLRHARRDAKDQKAGRSGAIMERGEQTILDRLKASLNAAAAMDSGTQAEGSAAAPTRRPAGLWGKATFTLVILIGAGVAWLAPRAHTDPDRLWAEAERAFLAGHWDRARNLLKTLERIRPKKPLDWLLEAQLATAEGHFDAAIAALGRVPDDHAIAGQSSLLAGRIERQRRRLRKAEAAFRRALELKPGLIEAHKELIYILGIQSRRHEVDAEFHALARLTRLTHHDLFTWALTHFTHWNPDIVDDLDGFIKADPEDRYSRLAVVELLLERPEVEDYIARILEPLPNTDPDALALRINLAFNLGQFDKAETLLASAPSNHPRIARIRGELALRRHDLDGAIRHFQVALSAEPYDRVSPMQLAQALQLKGDRTAADAYLDRVKRLNRLYNLIIRIRSPKRENQMTDLAELGKACEEAGLIEEAKGWYTLAITTDPLDSSAQEALYRLGQSTLTSSDMRSQAPDQTLKQSQVRLPDVAKP
jgi:tetratricopeptide (TPR) repeat protein